MKEDVLDQAIEEEELEESATEETQAETFESLAAERDNLIEQLQRSVAEFQNYRRRVDQDRLRAREFATQDVLRSILPIADDLQRAIVAIPPDDQESGIGSGVTAIERKLVGILERYGVVVIGKAGEPFDPALHEAVATDESGGQEAVVEVYQTGYRQGDNVLRPAMVKVGSDAQFDA